MARPTFDAGGFLKSQGLELVDGVDEAGTYGVKTPDGEVVRMDVQGFMKSQGVPLDKLDVNLNDPSAPVESSPVDLGDRAKLALGNARGGLEYLKSKYEDAAYTEDKGLVVKHKGVWHTVDPETDPWDLSKELGKDIVEGAVRYVPSMVGQVVGGKLGQAAGSALGGLVAGTSSAGTAAAPGAVAGGVAGEVVGSGLGAAAGEKLRTSLGRAVGTYKATPEEEAKDLALEGLFGMAGVAIPLGARPALDKFAKVTGGFKGASEAVKDLAAKVWGAANGTGPAATKAVIEKSPQVAAEMGRAAKSYAGVEGIKQGLAQEQAQVAENFLDHATKELPRKYGSMLDDLVQTAEGTKLRVNVGQSMSDAVKSVEDLGLGKVIGGELVPYTKAEVADRAAQGLATSGADDATVAKVNQILSGVEKYSSIGELQGSNAAKVLTDINKNLNSIQRSLAKQQLPAEVERALTQVGSKFHELVGSSFEKAGLGEKYTGMQMLYKDYGQAVGQARKILKSDNGIENLVARLTAQRPGPAAKGADNMAKLLAELTGDAGTKAYEDIMIKEAAKQYSTWAPKMGLTQVAAGGVGAMKGAAALAANPLSTAAAGVAMSPKAGFYAYRAGAKGVAYASSVKDFLVGLTPTQRLQLLKDPAATGAMFKTVLEAYGTEDDSANQLLQQAGVK